MCVDDKRTSLDAFCAEEITVDELAVRHPDCACESAPSTEGSHGPVADDEQLRLFLTSRSDINAKKPSHLEKRTFNATSLKKAYTNGLSTYRLKFASSAELESSAEILYTGKLETDPEYGGILAVMDFPVAAVRQCPGPSPAMCVLETPLDLVSAGKFLRPSHCDVVNSTPIPTDEERLAARRTIFNQIMAAGQKTRAEDVTDCDLVQFLPKVARKSEKGEAGDTA